MSKHKLGSYTQCQAVKYVHDGIVQQYLTKKEAIVYLKYYCFNDASINSILECAQNDWLFQDIEKKYQNNEDPQHNDYEQLLNEKTANPHLYLLSLAIAFHASISFVI
jgi:hypothetical protein